MMNHALVHTIVLGVVTLRDFTTQTEHSHYRHITVSLHICRNEWMMYNDFSAPNKETRRLE